MKKPKLLKIYFAHPMCEYGTKLEKEILNRIKNIDNPPEEYDGVEVVNPSDPKILKEFKKTNGGMKFFVDLVRTCDVIVGMSFPNGQWGSGVYQEMVEMENKGGTTYQVVLEWIGDQPYLRNLHEINVHDIRPMSVRETRETLRMIKYYKGGK